MLLNRRLESKYCYSKRETWELRRGSAVHCLFLFLSPLSASLHRNKKALLSGSPLSYVNKRGFPCFYVHKTGYAIRYFFFIVTYVQKGRVKHPAYIVNDATELLNMLMV